MNLHRHTQPNPFHSLKQTSEALLRCACTYAMRGYNCDFMPFRSSCGVKQHTGVTGCAAFVQFMSLFTKGSYAVLSRSVLLHGLAAAAVYVHEVSTWVWLPLPCVSWRPAAKIYIYRHHSLPD